MAEFFGKVAVVTGAGSGLGKAFAKRFAAEGMKVVIADVQRDALERTKNELLAEGTATLSVPTDVSSATAVQYLAYAATEEFGAVHLLWASHEFTRVSAAATYHREPDETGNLEAALVLDAFGPRPLSGAELREILGE